MCHGTYNFYKTVSTPPRIRDLRNERNYEYEVLRRIGRTGGTGGSANSRASGGADGTSHPVEHTTTDEKARLMDFMKTIGTESGVNDISASPQQDTAQQSFGGTGSFAGTGSLTGNSSTDEPSSYGGGGGGSEWSNVS